MLGNNSAKQKYGDDRKSIIIDFPFLRSFLLFLLCCPLLEEHSCGRKDNYKTDNTCTD